MPGMNGADVARQALAQRPRLPVLFVTGFAGRSAFAGISETQIVSKPFVNDELAAKCALHWREASLPRLCACVHR
jgi:CheY-like chemotaxis protein